MKRIIYSVIAFNVCFVITSIGALLRDLTELETFSFVLMVGGVVGICLLVLFWIGQLQENDW